MVSLFRYESTVARERSAINAFWWAESKGFFNVVVSQVRLAWGNCAAIQARTRA